MSIEPLKGDWSAKAAAADCMERRHGYCSFKCQTFDRLPAKVKKFLTRNNYRHKPEQFKKHRLRAR